MQTFLIAALLAAPAARALDLDLEQAGEPIDAVDGLPAVEVALPARVLADGEPVRLRGRRGTAVRARDGVSCAVHLADGSATLSPAIDRCEELFALAPGTHHDLLVQPPAPRPARILRLALAPAADSGPAVVEADGRILLPGAPRGAGDATVFVAGRWWPVLLDDRSWAIHAEGPAAEALAGWLQAPEGTVWIRAAGDGGSEVQWTLAPAQVPARPEPAGSPAVTADSGATGPLSPLGAWCRAGAGSTTVPVFLVCLDLDTGQTETRRMRRGGTVVQAGHHQLSTDSFIEVRVHHDGARDPVIELADRDAVSRGEELVVPATGDPGATSTSRRRFAPRPAGPVRLRVTDGDAVLLDQELEVVDRYQAALRVGLGVAFPASHSYARSTDGSTDGPIVRTSDDLLEGELVLGLAPFLEVGGRDGLDAAPTLLAPYLGMGLVAAAGPDLRATALQSWYGGVDVEFSPGFAVDAALTLRRVQRLVEGQEVGMFLPADDSVETRMVLRPGLAVVISLTPRPLRIPHR